MPAKIGQRERQQKRTVRSIDAHLGREMAIPRVVLAAALAALVDEQGDEGDGRERHHYDENDGNRR